VSGAQSQPERPHGRSRSARFSHASVIAPRSVDLYSPAEDVISLGCGGEAGQNARAMSLEMPPLPDDPGFWYPHWREMWEESLDDSTRKRIKNAAWRGLPLDDPVEARYAVTLAHKWRGAWRWWPIMALLLMGISLTRLVFATHIPLTMWTWSDWLLGFINTVVLLAAAPLAYRRYRLVVHAERRNRRVVELKESGT
jgi:hypothetical protein